MKTNDRVFTTLARSCGRAIAGLLILGCLGISNVSQAQFYSPEGTWDFVVLGAERGVAYITFEDDFTLSGYEVLTPAARKSTQVNETRGGDSIGRYTTESSGPTITTKTNLLGFAMINGFWTYDTKGHVIGIYTEGNEVEICTTNQLIVTTFETNIVDGVSVVTTSQSTNFVTDCVTEGVTNGISFTGVVRPGKRMVIKSTSAIGRYTLRGVPAAEVPDFSGWHWAMARSGGPQFTEFLRASPSQEFANVFDIVGLGAGYELGGWAIVSSHRQVGLVANGSSAGLTSVVGPYSFRKEKGTLKGSDLHGNRITYQINREGLP
jgi:hypothetical protein